MIAAMLVSIAREEAVEKLVNVLQILFLLRRGSHKGFTGEGSHDDEA